METKRVFIAGFGGQGILLIGQMLAYAAMQENKEVTWMPSYGPEMRGGTANCSVVISERPIASPLVSECDILVAMNGPSLDKYESMLRFGGELFVNESIITRKSFREDVSVNYVDCSGIALNELGREKAANMVMLGAVIKKTGIVCLDTMEKVCETLFNGSKSEHIILNKRALHSWKG